MAAPSLASLLTPFPGRLAFAARLALTCALTVLIAETYETLEIALSAYIVFFLTKEDRVSSIIMHISGLILITLIIGLIFLLAILVIDQPVWRVTTMALISFLVLFLGSASKLRAIAPILALVVAYALDLLGLIPQGELATRALLHAWLLIGVPVFAGLIVNLGLGTPPRLLAERTFVARLRAVAAVLRGTGSTAQERLESLLHDGNAALAKYLNFARIEHTSTAKDLAALQAAAASSFRLMALTDSLAALPSPPSSPEDRDKLAATAEAMAAIFETGRYPIDIEASLPSDAAPVLADMDGTLQHFTLAPPEAKAQKPKPKQKSGFFLPDAFSNPAHVRHALKTTAAAMICYIFYLQIDWSGIHTCLITCYIVSLGSAAETARKMMLRFIGAVIGAAPGMLMLVFVMPHLESIGALMILVFLGAFVAAWVAAGGERIAYAGFQIAFAFFLSAIQGYGPGFDLTVARDRVIGIFVGNLVMYVMATQVWPVSVSQRIGETIKASLRGLRDMAKSASQPEWNTGALAARNALTTLEDEIELVAFEPSALRPREDWIAARAQVSTELETTFRLLAPLTPADGPASLADCAAQFDQLVGPASAEEDRVAASVEASPGTSAAPTGTIVTDAARTALRQQIDRLTRALNTASDIPATGTIQQASHATV
ncbi:FUSC family protein [Beijerinckia indica]|uniref:Fusaric acid resistance protein conserved region n=1 Tax=Beijerinckia indica subsp. indica (strain ATCC 9039 / DSM 1715 / NCIMB 8712) TaxID=395963 RepID=B2ICG1_BEII9|nr:FUSC family protein [Beijerinckia indica]ACB93850.1 Fusaric acid resistance protein conserved region [Beijerinckia indica subsp. indica ATCC 9039]